MGRRMGRKGGFGREGKYPGRSSAGTKMSLKVRFVVLVFVAAARLGTFARRIGIGRLLVRGRGGRRRGG